MGTGEVESMQLRHIRPRSVEWYDALEAERGMGVEHLSPEETLRLRTLVAVEGEIDRQQQRVTRAQAQPAS